ncbi:MAG: permease [Hyphomicrobiales bacterium]|nr:permease [Hyphomicrobiales bacterium]
MSQPFSRPGSLLWLARHEARLAWRDWLAMMTAGRRRRVRTVAIALAVFVALMHLVAYSMIGRYASLGVDAGLDTLVTISGALLLSWSLMVSQAMESVTRVFYARSDLDLILSSPVSAPTVFSIRLATLTCAIVLMSLLLAAPFINVLTLYGGFRWLTVYGVVAATGLGAGAVAIAITVGLLRTMGAKRTRLVAQVVAAVIGAIFVIVLQLGAIMSYGTLSRTAFLESDALLAHVPAIGSIVYWPALAVLGDGAALGVVIGTGTLVFVLAVVIFAPLFSEQVIVAGGTTNAPVRRHQGGSFRRTTPHQALRRKEWTLLLRDPWLVSQTLMQILYLLPPAFLLWRSLDHATDALVVMVPVLVMAAGQLAGGLAWLAISGEDAPDLVATAPVPAGRLIRAKVEAVLGAIALVFLPFIVAMMLISPFHAVVASLGVIAASASATQIQLWFRSQAKRSLFRRRQISSRTATFAEAFSSITWAATATLAAAESILAVFTAVIALIILIAARLISPHRREPRYRAAALLPTT